MTHPLFIHPTAVVGTGAIIGDGTRVWHFCHIMAGARIGENCVLGQNVHVAGKVEIGAGCRIQNNVSLYDGVFLEDGVFVGPSAVFTNVSRPRALFPRRDRFEATHVRAGASIGANATIVCGITVGRGAFVGAGAVVTRDVPDFVVVTGSPARAHGFICLCGERLVAPTLICALCSRRYEPAGAGLREVSTP